MTINHQNVDELLKIVHELKASNYTVGMDFDFSHHPSSQSREPFSRTEFTFYNTKLATWFALKWM